jgi:hypothetical protein
MPSAAKAKVLRQRTKRQEPYLKANTVAAACDRWLRARGIAPSGKTLIDGTQQRNQKPNHEARDCRIVRRGRAIE